MPTPTSSEYGNMQVNAAGQPLDPAQRSKLEENGRKFGKKLGNAAIFGAGGKSCPQEYQQNTANMDSDHWFKFGKRYLLIDSTNRFPPSRMRLRLLLGQKHWIDVLCGTLELTQR